MDNKLKHYNNILIKVNAIAKEGCLSYSKICRDEGITYRQYKYAEKIIEQSGGSKKVKSNVKPKTKPKVKSKVKSKVKPKTKKIKTKKVTKIDDDKILKRQQKIYDKVLKLYNDKDYTVSEACKKIDISTAKYYKICKTLNMESIGAMRKERFKIKKQKGGSKNINDKQNEEFTMDDILKVPYKESRVDELLKRFGGDNMILRTDYTDDEVRALKDKAKKIVNNNNI